MFPLSCGGARWLAALSLSLLVFDAGATPSGLTLGETVRLALRQAPASAAGKAQLEAARQSAVRAGTLPDPMLTLGVDNLPVTGSEAFDPDADVMTMKTIGLRQEIPSGAKRAAMRSLAAREVEQAAAQLRVTRLAIQRAAADAWIDLWAATHELEALEALGTQSDIAVRLARARVAGGGGSAGEALAARAAALELDNRIEAARAREAAARAGLGRWVGNAAAAPSGDVSVFEGLPRDTTQLLSAIDRLAPVTVSTAAVEAAASAIDLARADKRPDWTVAAAYGQRSDGRDDMLMLEVGIGLPLFARNRQDRDVAAREAEYAAAIAIREDLRRQEAARIVADIARWEGLKRQVALHEEELLPLARDRSAVALAAYQAGGPLQPWLDARRDELAVHLAHAAHLGELGHAWAALAFLLPEETP